MRLKIIRALCVIAFLSSYVYADELSYDDGVVQVGHNGMYSNSSGSPAYYAVNFTPTDPTKKCQVLSGKAMIHIWQGEPQPCSVFVWNDNSGLPGNLMDSKDFTPIKSSGGDASWNQVDFFTGALFNPGVSFWVGVWMAPDDGTNINLILSDSILHNPGRDAGKANTGGWTIFPEGFNDWQLVGDLMIRALVQFIAVEENSVDAPKTVTLNQNLPNPVVNRTTISYSIPQAGQVNLKIYDVTGKLVRTLVNETQKAGLNEVMWDKKTDNGTTVSSGAYFYRLDVKGHNPVTKVMTVL